METLFRWIHLSDIHIGHGDVTNVHDQRLVLDELRRDVERQIRAQPAPPVDVILVTGDIGNTGAGRKPDEYTRAADWLRQVGDAAGVPAERIFVVPGNHDVNRGVDKDDEVKALVTALREGKKSLDAALATPGERALLARRMESYLAFARGFGPAELDPTGDRLIWVHRLVAPSGLPVRLVGLNTALLAAGDDDQGKLRVGMAQIEQTLLDVRDDELVLALGHHPLRGGWLADEAAIEPFLKRRVHALLTGHVHEADAEASRHGSGGAFLRVVAGSAHGDIVPGVPPAHGYSFGAVARGDDRKGSFRITPRKWSAKNASFRPDMDNIPEARTSSDHPLPESFALPVTGGTSAPAAPPAAVKVVPGEPVPVFISSVQEDDALREALQKHMSMLRRNKKAVFTHSQERLGGEDRAQWIAERVKEARVVLLLISKDYIASDECYEEELLRAIERHERGEARVIPIWLRKYHVSEEPFAKLQALPRDGHPVEGHPKGLDGALALITYEVGRVIAQMRGEPPPPPPR